MIDLEAVYAAHRPYGMNCKCGEDINSDQGWAAHLVHEVRLATQRAHDNELQRVRRASRVPQTPVQWDSYLKNRGLIPW